MIKRLIYLLLIPVIANAQIGGGGISHSGSRDHGLLRGLGDDDHSQYLLLQGRSGGQTAYGGTGIGESLTLRSTSNSTLGALRLQDSFFRFRDATLPNEWNQNNLVLQLFDADRYLFVEADTDEMYLGVNSVLNGVNWEIQGVTSNKPSQIGFDPDGDIVMRVANVGVSGSVIGWLEAFRTFENGYIYLPYGLDLDDASPSGNKWSSVGCGESDYRLLLTNDVSIAHLDTTNDWFVVSNNLYEDDCTFQPKFESTGDASRLVLEANELRYEADNGGTADTAFPGTDVLRARNQGVVIGNPTGNFLGPGSLNAEAIYVNGVQLNSGSQNAVRAYATTATLFGAGSVDIPFEAESFDDNNWHDNVTNPDRFTVPSGVNRVRININIRLYTCSVDATTVDVEPKINGITQDSNAKIGYMAGSTSVMWGNLTYVYPVSAGDYLQFKVTTNSGTCRIDNADANRTWVYIEAI